jgi:hypothetical protein
MENVEQDILNSGNNNLSISKSTQILPPTIKPRRESLENNFLLFFLGSTVDSNSTLTEIPKDIMHYFFQNNLTFLREIEFEKAFRNIPEKDKYRRGIYYRFFLSFSQFTIIIIDTFRT